MGLPVLAPERSKVFKVIHLAALAVLKIVMCNCNESVMGPRGAVSPERLNLIVGCLPDTTARA